MTPVNEVIGPSTNTMFKIILIGHGKLIWPCKTTRWHPAYQIFFLTGKKYPV